MWDLPSPGLEPVFPALAGRFSTTAPPWKPPRRFFNFDKILFINLFFCGWWFLYPKKLLPILYWGRYPLIFSSRSYILLDFTFRSMSYFELTFIYGVRKGVEVWVLFFYRTSSFSSNICWKYFPFLLNFFGTFIETQFAMCGWIYFWTLFCLLICIFLC